MAPVDICDAGVCREAIEAAPDSTALSAGDTVLSKAGVVVTIPHSVVCCLPRRARFKNLNPKAWRPERMEFFSQYPERAVELVKDSAQL